MKKSFSLLLVAAMLMSALTACGGGTAASGGSAPAASGSAASGSSASAPAQSDGKVYTLRYASFSSTESSRYQQFEAVFEQKIKEASGGRLVFEMYPNSTLCAPPEAMDMVSSGACDICTVMGAQNPGQFPYEELFSTPGLYYGNSAEASALAREYCEKFTDAKYQNDFIQLVRYSTDELCLITSKPVNSIGDLSGLSLRASASVNDFYSELGISPVSMAANEMYEGIRLGTIDGVESSVVGLHTWQLYQVADYAIDMPIHKNTEAVFMSRDKFNSLPDDLQKILLDVSAEMEKVYDDYQTSDEQTSLDVAAQENPKFVYSQFSDADVKSMEDTAAKYLEKKAKELDDQGLDGSGALQFLRDNAKTYQPTGK